MPLPLIPVAIGLAILASTGVIKGVNGARKMTKAKKLAKEAQENHENSVSNLKDQRASVVDHAENYANYLIEIQNKTFKKTIDILNQIGGGHKEMAYETLSEIGVTQPELQEYKQSIVYVESILEGGLTALIAGGTAGPAATTGAVLFGATASTGASIGSLSGAASTNALLAWFGGGAISAGGGGIAAGTLMLGGIAIAPALAVTGFVLDKKGQKAFTGAQKYVSEVNESLEKIATAVSFLGQVEVQIKERNDLMVQLNSRAQKFISNIEAENFNKENDKHIKELQGLLQLVKAQSEIMQASIISEDGNRIDQTGLEIVTRSKRLIKERA
jgi:hypothetical protein